MAKFSRGKKLKNWNSNTPEPKPGKLRIIGGTYRGRQIDYLGDPRTRPMKDNVREALFNLVGGWIKGKYVFDLFAGTGAVGLEAMSRGAVGATLIERHIPTNKIIQSNIKLLDSKMPAEVVGSDTFFWMRSFLKPDTERPQDPWVVFFCPPYALFEERKDDLLGAIEGIQGIAPKESLIVVESDSRFNPSDLPMPESWQVRTYSPAIISVCKIGFENQTDWIRHD